MRISANNSQARLYGADDVKKDPEAALPKLKEQLKGQEQQLSNLLESFNSKFGNMKNPLVAETTGRGGALNLKG